MENLKDLIINPSIDKEILNRQLENYSAKIKVIMDLLENSNNSSHKKIRQQLFGQHIFNLDDDSHLLQIEYPVYIPKYNKIIPAYLAIKKENGGKKEDDKKKDEYKISFIISLMKIGTVRADTIINSQLIKCSFYCNKKKTREIIAENFPKLKRNLEKIGFSVKDVKIKDLKTKDQDDVYFKNRPEIKPILRKNEEFIHIDIKA